MSSAAVVPVNGWVIVRPATMGEQKSKGGIIIPENAVGELVEAEVIFSDAEDFILAPGVKVLYPATKGRPIKLHNEDFIRVRDHHIVCILKPVQADKL